MNPLIPQTNRVNVLFPDKAEFWSNSVPNQIRVYMLSPCCSLVFWEKHIPSGGWGWAARSGWDVSGSKARWINFKCPYLPIAAQLYPLYFQDSLGCCSSSALFFQYSHFNLTWAANKIPFPICVVGGAECASGHAASKDRVHSHVGHSLISATLLCCSSPLKGSEQTTFCRSAWMAPKPRS